MVLKLTNAARRQKPKEKRKKERKIKYLNIAIYRRSRLFSPCFLRRQRSRKPSDVRAPRVGARRLAVAGALARLADLPRACEVRVILVPAGGAKNLTALRVAAPARLLLLRLEVLVRARATECGHLRRGEVVRRRRRAAAASATARTGPPHGPGPAAAAPSTTAAPASSPAPAPSAGLGVEALGRLGAGALRSASPPRCPLRLGCREGVPQVGAGDGGGDVPPKGPPTP